MSNTASATEKPRVILGLMTFGPDPSTGARVLTKDEFAGTLDLLQSRGYGEVDTARMYCGTKQEAWTRDAGGWKERGLGLATKVMYPRPNGINTKAGVRESVELSLKDLGTEKVDLLYLHAPDRAIPFPETVAEINALHKEGKFDRLGLSNFAAFEVAEICTLCAVNGWVRPTVYQGMYNLLTRSLERELLPCLRRFGIELVVYNPLAGGLLTGKVKSMDLVPDDGGRFSDTNPTAPDYRKRYFRDAVFRALKLAEQAAETEGVGMAEMSLRWCVHHSALCVGGNGSSPVQGSGKDGVIIGVSSKEQLGKNLDALEKGPLKPETVELLKQAWVENMVDTPNYWHGELKYEYDTIKEIFSGQKGLGQ